MGDDASGTQRDMLTTIVNKDQRYAPKRAPESLVPEVLFTLGLSR